MRAVRPASAAPAPAGPVPEEAAGQPSQRPPRAPAGLPASTLRERRQHLRQYWYVHRVTPAGACPFPEVTLLPAVGVSVVKRSRWGSSRARVFLHPGLIL